MLKLMMLDPENTRTWCKRVQLLLFAVIIYSELKGAVSADDSNEINWGGHWFPFSVDNPIDNNPTVSPSGHRKSHGPPMGVSNPNCDDGKTNLSVDWKFSPVNFTCFEGRTLVPNAYLKPIYTNEHVPKSYVAIHKCMNESIEYGRAIPTYGSHRPLWAEYGEYKFLPKQRWLHNLEHGSVVMLYHPCADRNEVRLLKYLVKSCLYRHIITPYTLVSHERPLALVTWGYRLEMSKVAPRLVKSFIKEHANKGPEHTSHDGQFRLMLEEHACVVSDINDTVICPGS